MLQQFARMNTAYPEYHVTLNIPWHMCVKLEGPSIDRAWEAIGNLFSGEP